MALGAALQAVVMSGITSMPRSVACPVPLLDGLGGGCLCVEGGDTDDVVDSGGDLEPGPVPVPASVAELAAAGDGLGPAEWLFDSFPDPLADVWPGWRVVRPSIAEIFVFWATCGVSPSARASATNPLVS